MRLSAHESTPEMPEISTKSFAPRLSHRWLASLPEKDAPARSRSPTQLSSGATSSSVPSPRTTVRQKRLHVSSGRATCGGAV